MRQSPVVKVYINILLMLFYDELLRLVILFDVFQPHYL